MRPNTCVGIGFPICKMGIKHTYITGVNLLVFIKYFTQDLVISPTCYLMIRAGMAEAQSDGRDLSAGAGFPEEAPVMGNATWS